MSYPLSIPRSEFIPYGEEAEWFVVHGWIPECLMLDGVFAAMVENDCLREVADCYSVPEEDDELGEFRSEEEFAKAVEEAFRDEHTGAVKYGYARWWELGDEDCPCGSDGGVQVSRKPEPDYVPATWLEEH